MAAMYARFCAAAFRPSAVARTPARAFFLSFSAARLFKSRAAMRAVYVSFVLSIVLCHNPLQGRSKKKLGLVSILEICGSDMPLFPKETVGLHLGFDFRLGTALIF